MSCYGVGAAPDSSVSWGPEHYHEVKLCAEPCSRSKAFTSQGLIQGRAEAQVLGSALQLLLVASREQGGGALGGTFGPGPHP